MIEGLEQTLLFDTGGDGGVLLANMARMGIDPSEIDAVFLSHFHSDHTRGLRRILQRNPNVTVFMPASFPGVSQKSARESGARVFPIAASRKLFARAHSSGPMGQAPEEQALMLDTDQGVAQVAPSRCTGDRATALFRDAWGEDFLKGGCGAVIVLAP